MPKVRSFVALGVLCALPSAALPGQMVGARSAPPPTVRPPSALPPVTMGSRIQPRRIDRGYGYGSTFGISSCFGNRYDACRAYGRFGRHSADFYRYAYALPPSIAYEVPVYVPVPVPVYTAAPPAKAPSKPYDPEKSRMLTIGAGADGGGGVMRIESVSDSVVRIVWLGSPRPIREAQLFLADSAQRPLRSALVDEDTPSALFRIADVKEKIIYYGLTITYSDGAIATTLVPRQSTAREPVRERP